MLMLYTFNKIMSKIRVVQSSIKIIKNSLNAYRHLKKMCFKYAGFKINYKKNYIKLFFPLLTVIFTLV